jgi:hypothetical protein
VTDQQLTFRNQTPMPLDLAVWQLPLPPAPLVSVYWMRLKGLPGGQTVQTWSDELAVVLGLYAASRFSIAQLVPAGSGSAWTIASLDGAQTLVRAGSAPSEDKLLVENISAAPANAGLAQSGAAAFYAQNLQPGEAASLPATRTYMAGLFTSANPGEVIDPTRVLAPPLPLVFPPGVGTATAIALVQNAGIVLTITY